MLLLVPRLRKKCVEIRRVIDKINSTHHKGRDGLVSLGSRGRAVMPIINSVQTGDKGIPIIYDALVRVVCWRGQGRGPLHLIRIHVVPLKDTGI